MAEGGQQSENLSGTVKGGSEEHFECYCYPCHEDGRHVQAFGFCKNCSDYLCDECYNTHCRTKLWRHHVLLEIKHLPKDFTALPKVVPADSCTSICNQHPDKFIEYFCHGHDSLMCHLCAFSKHKKCESLHHIPSVANTIGNDKELTDTHTLQGLACQILKTSEECKTASDDSSSEAINSAARYRQAITLMLQEQEKELEAEAKGMNSENKKMLKAASSEVNATLVDMKTTLQSINMEQKDKRFCDLFVSVKQAQKAIPLKSRDFNRVQQNVMVDAIKFEPNLKISCQDGCFGRMTASSVRKDTEEWLEAKYNETPDPLNPTQTEKNEEKTENVASTAESKPRVEMFESKFQRGPSAGEQVEMRDSPGESVAGAGSSKTIGATGETRTYSINRKQKIRFTESKPGRRENNKYVFDVGSIYVLVYNQSVVDIANMDAIVNAANDQLVHAGGIAFFISKAAGKDMNDDCYRHIKNNGPLKVGDVYVSMPGRMNCKGIFHAVGPRWSEYIGREDECAKDLYKTIYQCLKCLDDNGWKNIALCAISSGIFGVPKQLCAAMYLKAIEDFAIQHPNSAIEVHFIDVNQEILDLMESAHRDRLKEGSSPDFKFAFKFRSAKKGYPGQTYSQRTNRHARGYDDITGTDMHAQWAKGSYKHVQPMTSVDKWTEFKPVKEQDVEIDIDKFCKLPSKKQKATQLQVESTSEGQCAVHILKTATKKFPCGHKLCTPCSIQSKTECQKCKEEKKSTKNVNEKKAETSVEKLNCPICLEDHDSLASLPCSHEFCKVCLKRAAKEKPVCPLCWAPFGIVTGTQPDGRMFVRTVQNSLPGYASVGTIEIKYEFKDGKQENCHPNPGKRYSGITRTAYLPDNEEGQKVLRLLKKAFSRRLVFTIGDSRTTGQTGQITWNDIHHKTTPCEGGLYGYPDETYLSRIQQELAANGITE